MRFELTQGKERIELKDTFSLMLIRRIERSAA